MRFNPVFGKPPGGVVEVARSVPTDETSKYRLEVTIDPFGDVEEKVSLCHPGSKSLGKGAEKFAAPDVAVPVARTLTTD